jgi:redox-sensing transcriptional repressor
VYLRTLAEAAEDGVSTISSERLAELAGVNAAKVRKDLSHLGSYGTRGVGYDVDYLAYQMSRELGLTEERAVVIVGAGNLGQALVNYGGFSSRGFPILAVVDSDPAKVGRVIAGVRVRPVEDLPAIVAEAVNTIGVVATPAGVAQSVADRLVEAGVRSILNFAPVVLTVPDEVLVRKVDLATELQILSFYQQRSSRRSPRRSSAGAA